MGGRPAHLWASLGFIARDIVYIGKEIHWNGVHKLDLLCTVEGSNEQNAPANAEQACYQYTSHHSVNRYRYDIIPGTVVYDSTLDRRRYDAGLHSPVRTAATEH